VTAAELNTCLRDNLMTLSKEGPVKKQRIKIVCPRRDNDASPYPTVFAKTEIRYDMLRDADFCVLEGTGISIEIEDLEQYVQVEFLDPNPRTDILSKALWTYRAPEGLKLEVGDIVSVDTRYSFDNRAIVRKLDADERFVDAQTRYVNELLWGVHDR
jgi:hypothetical protein